MGNLFWLDYTIIAAVGLLVVLVLYLSFRDSRKRKSSGCSGACSSCSYACDTKMKSKEESACNKARG